jgi:DNA-binding winged helix-turn-helix (wHTH) protein
MNFGPSSIMPMPYTFYKPLLIYPVWVPPNSEIPMSAHLTLVRNASHQRFAFDYNRNVVFFQSGTIHLSPHEADILHLLLKNRARVTPMAVLIQQVYGVAEPDTAAISIRVAIHSLRKKLAVTGIKIKAEARVGYEIDVKDIPALDLGLSEKILSALNVAQASGVSEIANRLEAMLVELAAAK